VIARAVRRNFERLNRREVEPVLGRFTPDAHFRFRGDHPLGADLRGPDAIRAWFARAFDLLPDLCFGVDDVTVAGAPWRLRVVTRYTARGTGRDGRPFSYEGVQFLRVRWGRVAEDLLYPDTQAIAAALAGP
jgi:ketosteroid isomerase-like protein